MKRALLTKAAILAIALASMSCSTSQPQTSQTTAEATPTPRRLSKDEKRDLPIEQMDVADVYPTADGGAYVISAEGKLWYAKGDRATRVTNGSVAQTGPRQPNSQAAAFTLLSNEHRRARKLRDALDMAESEVKELKGER